MCHRPEWMMAAHATHLPLLAACVAHTSGPVLELGCGPYSTPLLHAMCFGRSLCSLETDADWYKRFQGYHRDHHTGVHVTDPWEEVGLGGPWDVVLVDHSPPQHRVQEIARLRPVTRLFVVHDTEHRLYAYEPVLETFPYRIEWRCYSPWTSVVSDSDPLDWLEHAA